MPYPAWSFTQLFATYAVLFATIVTSAGVSQRQRSLPEPTEVFSFNEDGFVCTRIPSLLHTPDGALLAFAECRQFNHDGCEPVHPLNMSGPFGLNRFLCMKASLDGGATWSSLRSNLTGTRVANPSAVYNAIGEVVVQYDDPGDVSLSTWQVKSTDQGKTWSAPLNVSASSTVTGFHSGTAGSGARVTVGPHAGRLVFVGYAHYKSNNTLAARVWYSDDHGETYQSSLAWLPHMGEPQMSEVKMGAGSVSMLLIVARNNNHVDCRCRMMSVSKDAGVTWSEPQPVESLTDPACQGALVGLPGGDVYVSGPDSATSRVWMGLWHTDSMDLAAWKHTVNVSRSTTAAAAYSALAALSNTSVGLLWETSATDCVGPSCRIVYQSIDVPTAGL